MKSVLHLRLILAVLGTVAGALLWLFFAPVQAGGQAFYAIVNGSSMEPLFHRGDLVILRQTDEYQIGDIVAYANPDIGPVFHQIVGQDVSGFVMQGVNNAWVDSYEPKENEIYGKYWAVIRGAGDVMTYLRNPVRLAILVGILVVMAGMMKYLSDLKKKRTGAKLVERAGNCLAAWRESYWWVVYSLGAIGLILSVICFVQPLQKNATEKLDYSQAGNFSYTSQADPAIYDSGSLHTGDPVYLALTCNVRFGFNYALTPGNNFAGGGTYQLLAILQASNGWQKSFVLTPKTAFTGGTFQTSASFDVCQLNDLIAQLQSKTSVTQLQYNLVLTPNVAVNGSFVGQPLAAAFNPPLKLVFDGQQLYYPPDSDSSTSAFTPAENGFIDQNVLETNTLNILSLALPISTGRVIALVLLLVGLLGILLPACLYRLARKTDALVAARILFGRPLLEIEANSLEDNQRFLDLTSLEALASVAERYDQPVFFTRQHGATGSVTLTYFVYRENLVYRWVVRHE